MKTNILALAVTILTFILLLTGLVAITHLKHDIVLSEWNSSHPTVHVLTNIKSEPAINIEEVKAEIREDIEPLIAEYGRANKEAVENFARNLQTDILALRENIPVFVDEITSFKTSLRFAKAIVKGWVSDDGDPAAELAGELVEEHLVSTVEVEEMIQDNLETLGNDLAYNRNRLYAQVRDVIYMRVDNMPLSELEIREVLENTVTKMREQTAGVTVDGMKATVLKEIGVIGLSEAAGYLLTRLASGFAGWCTTEVATGAAILATTEGAGSVTGIVGFAAGIGVYFAVDYFMSEAHERALTEKSEKMIGTLARDVVYGENSDGLYYRVTGKVKELTAGDINYINTTIDGIKE